MRAGRVESLEERRIVLVSGTDPHHRHRICGEKLLPLRDAQAGLRIAANVTATEVVPLRHPDGGVPVVVEEEDLDVELVGVYRAEFLQVLGEAAVTLDQHRTPAPGRKRRADRSGEPIAHGGETLVGDDPLPCPLRERLHHHRKGAAAGAGDHDVFTCAQL